MLRNHSDLEFLPWLGVVWEQDWGKDSLRGAGRDQDELHTPDTCSTGALSPPPGNWELQEHLVTMQGKGGG